MKPVLTDTKYIIWTTWHGTNNPKNISEGKIFKRVKKQTIILHISTILVTTTPTIGVLECNQTFYVHK